MKPRQYTFVVNVPQTDTAAYNPNRPASDLIRQQLKFLHAAEQTLPSEVRTGVDIGTLSTEHHASSYAAHVMQRIVDQTKPPTQTHRATRVRRRVPKPPARKATPGRPRPPRPKGRTRTASKKQR